MSAWMKPVDRQPETGFRRALYAYRVGMKWLSFLIFGLGTLFLALAALPALRLLLHPKERFQRLARRMLFYSMRFFVWIMRFLRVVEVRVEDRAAYAGLHSKILVANHPSLLDVVILISLVPNADCIVNAKLLHNIVSGVIRHLYIPNSVEFDRLLHLCDQSLKQGNCLIIFPEGTRTPRRGKTGIKKGAARLALFSGCGVAPVHIGGTDKYGLGKGDPWTGFNPADRYVYSLRMLEEISPRKYAGLPEAAAAKRLTGDIKDALGL